MIDYAKFTVYQYHDVFQDAYLAEWYRTLGPDTQDGRKVWRLTALGTTIDGKGRYTLETWGHTAGDVTCLKWERWGKFLTRLDVVSVFPNENPHMLDQLYDELRTRGLRHNLTRMSSKPRSKSGGKSAGGESIAVGSHKSDFRYSIYWRDYSLVRTEVQLSGNQLKRMTAEADRVCNRDDGVVIDPWSLIEANVWAKGMEFRRNVIADDTEWQLFLASPDAT